MLFIKHLCMLVPGGLFATPGGPSSGMDSGEFLAEAMRENLAEVEASTLALDKATNDAVKAFSQRMIDEHSRIGREIEHLAGKKKVSLPNDISDRQQSELDELSKLSGNEFDKRFMGYNVREHQQEIRHFQEQSEKGTDPEVKAFAQSAVKRLSDHLDMAKKLEQSLA